MRGQRDSGEHIRQQLHRSHGHLTIAVLVNDGHRTGGGGSTTAPTPPTAPAGTTTTKSVKATTPSGTTTLTDAALGLVLTAAGVGALTVGGYQTDPVTSVPASATGKYIDVEVVTGSDFTSLAVKVCDVDDGNGLDWFNGTAWLGVSDASLGATGWITAQLSATTSPSLAELAGTVLAVTSTTRQTTPPKTTSLSLAQGYHEVASDGGIFTFGTAHFYGSMGGQRLDKPVVGTTAS